ncbi:CsbA family protein [Niallia sp. XMNu-256]|uniref:CsbA family protein n=1 Tax=Niallia sp. XMNu-256 TaxID=3082444 RepID=UPI0030D21ACD
MFTKFVLALILPGLLVVFFSRVTYSRILALILSVALIAASAYKGYTDTFLLIIVDALSLTVGFWYATRMKQKMNKIENLS